MKRSKYFNGTGYDDWLSFESFSIRMNSYILIVFPIFFPKAMNISFLEVMLASVTALNEQHSSTGYQKLVEKIE